MTHTFIEDEGMKATALIIAMTMPVVANAEYFMHSDAPHGSIANAVFTYGSSNIWRVFEGEGNQPTIYAQTPMEACKIAQKLRRKVDADEGRPFRGCSAGQAYTEICSDTHGWSMVMDDMGLNEDYGAKHINCFSQTNAARDEWSATLQPLYVRYNPERCMELETGHTGYSIGFELDDGPVTVLFDTGRWPQTHWRRPNHWTLSSKEPDGQYDYGRTLDETLPECRDVNPETGNRVCYARFNEIDLAPLPPTGNTYEPLGPPEYIRYTILNTHSGATIDHGCYRWSGIDMTEQWGDEEWEQFFRMYNGYGW